MDPPATAEPRYDVFISYSTDPDYNLSRRVESFLESFHQLKLLSGHELKPLRVCRDGSDFSLHRLRQQATSQAQATDEVQQVLAEYLGRSEYLLVLCSGSAARSAYVGFEVEWFIRNRGADKVLLAVTEGADRSGDLTGLFPKPVLDSQLHQRIFYDLRGFKPEAKHWVKVRNYEEELTRLAADLNGETLGDILPSWQQEELRQLRRQRYAVGVAAAVLLALAVMAGIQWYRADRSRAEALTQQANARNQLARNYWSNAHAALDANDPLKFAHLLGQAAAFSEDTLLTQDVLLDGQALRPRYQLAAILGHDLLGAAFSPDAGRVVGWSLGTAQVWQTSDGQPVSAVFRHPGTQLGIADDFDATAFSPDGSQLVSWGRDGIRQWRGATSRLLVPSPGVQIMQAAFSPDGRELVSWSGKGMQRWRATDGQPIGPLLHHPAATDGAAFSPDQRRALSWSDEHLQLWRLDTGLPVGQPLANVQQAAFSPDGQYFAAWSYQGAIRVYAAATGQPVGQPLQYPPGANGSLAGVAFSPGSQLVLAWGSNGGRLWQTATSEPVGEPLQAGQLLYGVGLSPDETQVLTWGQAGLWQWQVADGKLVGQPMQHTGGGAAGGVQDSRPTDPAMPRQRGARGLVAGAAYSRDGRRILSWGGNTVQVWQAATGLPLTTPLPHEGPVEAASFCADEQRIVAWGPGGIRLWQAARYLPGQWAHRGPVSQLRFSRDGQFLLTYGQDSTLRLWDVAGHRPLGPPLRQGSAVAGALFSAGGRGVVSWGDDSTLYLRDGATGGLLGRLRHPGPVAGAQFDAGGRRLVAWGNDTARLWNAATGQAVGRPFPASGATFSRDGSCLLTWADSTVQLRRTDNGQLLGPPMRHAGLGSLQSVAGASFSDDERSILSWGLDGIRRWQRATGQAIGPLLAFPGPVRGARFYQHEKRLLAFEAGNLLQLWQLGAAVRPVGPPLRHELMMDDSGEVEAFIGGVALSADEHRLLSWGNDGVRLWRADTGQPLLPLLLLGADNPVDSARFSRDGRRILAWGRDGSLGQWQADTGQPLLPPLLPNGVAARLAFTTDERWLVAGDADGRLHRWVARPDLDLPPALLVLELQALTGTALDLNTQEPYVLAPAQWRRVRRRYEQQAAAHYAACRYREANTWATFRPQPK